MESRGFMYHIVSIEKSIFREYDLRGIVGTEINEDVAYTIGRSFASYVTNKTEKVLVGYDNRLSSKALHDALVAGLMESGADVVSLGLVTTPMYYYGRVYLRMNQGIMITASHNPKEYNGFKIAFDAVGNAVGPEIKKFQEFTEKKEFAKSTLGFYEEVDIRNPYIQAVQNGIDLGPKKIKAVIDCGNGTGSVIVKELMEACNIDYIPIYCESDGTFPNHHPDPSVHENMLDLSKKVLEVGADLGIGIDGDADRVGIVDNKGTILNADMYLLLMYRFLAPTLSKKEALYDVKCSKTLIDELDKLGYEKTMYRTGNSYINRMMQEHDFVFGGEYSGHVYFKDKFPGFDDGIYAGLRMIELLSKSEETISEMLEHTTHYFSTPEEKVKVTEESKFEIVKKILEFAKENHYQIIDIDGVRAQNELGWALVRASNTGPNLTVRFESNTEEGLKVLKETFMNQIEKERNNMMKSKVYFTKEISPESLIRIYEALGVELKGNVGIKVSTGEKGSKGYLKAALIKPLVDKLNGTIIECNTAYPGKRNTEEDHLKVAEEHGFTSMGKGVEIMDAKGEIKIPVVNGKHLQYDLIGEGFEKYDAILNLAHGKGHAMGGFGANLKNQSIGIASRNGKAYIHSCGKTEDPNLCWSVSYEQKDFIESMAEAAKAVSDHLKEQNKPIVYITVANALSVDCDCDENQGDPVMADLGIFASLDPVANDQAFIDAVWASKDEGAPQLQARVDRQEGRHITEYAESIGLGSTDYELIEI